jgi:hypothetical protein
MSDVFSVQEQTVSTQNSFSKLMLRLLVYMSPIWPLTETKLKSVEVETYFSKNLQNIIVLNTHGKSIDNIHTSLVSFTEKSKKWCGGKCYEQPSVQRSVQY